MATMLNVNRKVDDQFYRYKMPKLDAKVEGKGNGIKTVITNMMDIAKAIYRPPAYPTKFFGCELGAQTQIDKKNERYIVNGSHTPEKLQEILDSFIAKFVLCSECENPETTFIVQPKKEKITSQCTACGHAGAIDMGHRLSTFILKNPPTDDSAIPHKLKKVKDSQAKADESADGSGLDGWGDDPLPASQKTTDNVWSEDTSDAAVRRRQEVLGDGIKGLTVNSDLEKSEKDRVDMFYTFVKTKIGDDKLVKINKDKDIILGEAVRLDVKDQAAFVLSELLFDADILAQIAPQRALFLRFLVNNQKAQKQLMHGFELIVAHNRELLMPKVARILKEFYERDYLEEEVILDWGQKVSKKFVSKDIATAIHEKAKPFLAWLNEADEESDEDDDGGVDVVYTHRTEDQIEKQAAKEEKAKEVKAVNGTAAVEEDLDEDDIDNI